MFLTYKQNKENLTACRKSEKRSATVFAADIITYLKISKDASIKLGKLIKISRGRWRKKKKQPPVSIPFCSN